MKSKLEKIIILIAILLLSLQFINFAESIKNEKKYIIKSPNSVTKNLLVSNNKFIKKIDYGSEFIVIKDEFTDNEFLIKTNQMEQIEGPGGIWDDELPEWTVKVDSKHQYFNYDNMQQYDIDENLNIEYVINGYGIITNYELKQAELDRLIDERKKENTMYWRDIENYSRRESNYNKSYSKVYDFKNNKIIELDRSYNSITFRDSKFYGIIKNENNEISIYKIDNNFTMFTPVLKEDYISIPLYKSNFINNCIEYRDGKFDKDLNNELVKKNYFIVNNKKYYFVQDSQYKFIVDYDGEIVSKKYECEILKTAINFNNINFASSNNLKDTIFERKCGKKLIYFTIDKDLFEIEISEDYTYNLANRKGLVGRSLSYAIIDDKNNAHIYNSNGDLITKIQYIKKINGDEIILDSFEVHNRFVFGTYIENKKFKDPVDYILSLPNIRHYSFVILNGEQSFDYNVVSDAAILKMNGKYDAIQNTKTNATFVIDNNKCKVFKELNNLSTIKKFTCYNCGGKDFYIFYTNYGHSSIYDENFNIFIDGDDFISCTFGNELMCIEKIKYSDNIYNEYLILDSEKNCVSKFDIKKNYNIILMKSDKGDLIFKPIYDDDGNIKDLIVIGNRLIDEHNLYPIKEYEVDRMDNDNLFLFHNKDFSFIVNNKGEVVKKFNSLVEYINSNKSFIGSNSLIIDKEKLILYLRYYDIKESKRHNVLIDYNGNTLLDDSNDYKVNFYGDSYSYCKNDSFYLLDYDNSVIFKTSIESIN